MKTLLALPARHARSILREMRSRNPLTPYARQTLQRIKTATHIRVTKDRYIHYLKA